MKTINCWDDMSQYGILPLTGEACGLMYRILCDVTARRKVAIFGPEFRNDAGPSRLGLTEGFDASTVAGQAFDSRIPSADIITRRVREAAEQRRRDLEPWQNDLEICEVKAVVPEAYELAEARKVSSRPRARDREVHPQFIKSIAYAEALASDPALTAVEAMQGFESSDYPPRRAERAAPAYASVALAAAKSFDGDSAEQVRIFDRS